MSDLKRKKVVATAAAAALAALSGRQAIASTVLFNGSYTPNFSSALPDPGATSVNTANPVTIAGTSYSLQSNGGVTTASEFYDFANPIDTTADGYSSASGGLNPQLTSVTPLSGWYGASGVNGVLGSKGSQFGATDGDQTTGGQISFGAASSSTRALGLMSTGTTGYTATGVELINNTAQTINTATISFVYETWREGKNAQTESAYYTVDNSVSDTIVSALAAAEANTGGGALPGSLSVDTTTTLGTAANIDGTNSANQQDYSGTLTGLSWAPGGALWISFADSGATSGGGGIGIQTDSVATGGTLTAPFISSPVPEPTTLGLMGVGVMALLGRRRRKD